jgi:hypothetical protein
MVSSSIKLFQHYLSRAINVRTKKLGSSKCFDFPLPFYVVLREGK